MPSCTPNHPNYYLHTTVMQCGLNFKELFHCICCPSSMDTLFSRLNGSITGPTSNKFKLPVRAYYNLHLIVVFIIFVYNVDVQCGIRDLNIHTILFSYWMNMCRQAVFLVFIIPNSGLPSSIIFPIA